MGGPGNSPEPKPKPCDPRSNWSQQQPEGKNDILQVEQPATNDAGQQQDVLGQRFRDSNLLLSQAEVKNNDPPVAKTLTRQASPASESHNIGVAGRTLKCLDPEVRDTFTRFSKDQRAITVKSLRTSDVEQHGNGGGNHGHGSGNHGHGGGSPSWPNAIASGIINYLLMFGLCCAYGMIMFDDSNAQHRAIGVKLNLCTAMLFGFLLVGCSQVKVAVGGPDLNPVVFLGGFVTTVSLSIAEELGLEHPLAADGGRRLGASSSGGAAATFCVGTHWEQNSEACGAYASQVVATSIFAVAVSSVVLSAVFLLVGQFRLVKYFSYVPTCVMEAFMACVGYKVFKYAIYFCNYEPRQFVPAACVGVPLYFLKAYHIGNPVIVIPSFLFVPLGLFYAATFLSGSNLSQEVDWMFPKIENAPFWQIWTDTLRDGGSNINFKAWAKTGPDLIVMVIVCFLDCLLKMMGTEGKLPVKLDKNIEMRLYGFGNIVTTLCGSSVGYAQLKFNVINYGILGGLDRRGGLVYAVLCGATFFSTIEHFNFLPRFFLGILLFFAGSGFIVENLWGSRMFLSIVEWCQVLIILAVFVVSQSLLYAVLTGGVLTCIDFILTCARMPCTADEPGTYHTLSAVRRAPLAQGGLGHVLARHVLVVRLKGEVFFASAQQLVNSLLGEIQEAASIPKYKSLRFVLFDCSLVESIDASTGKLLRKLTDEARRCDVKVLYAGPNDSLRKRIKAQKLLENETEIFSCIEQALESIEDQVLDKLEQVKTQWTSLHESLGLYGNMMMHQHCFDPFREVFHVESVRRGCPYRFCVGLSLKRLHTLLWEPGETGVGLFLVTSGSVAFFPSLPDGKTTNAKDGMATWVQPAAIYRGGSFINPRTLLDLPTEYYAVAYEDGDVLYWSQRAWAKMNRLRPRMAASISKEAMKHMGHDVARLVPLKIAAQRMYPKEVDMGIVNMRVAQSLSSFGFYQSSLEHTKEATLLPKMPASLRQDLQTSFDIFAAESEAGLLHPDKVSAALMLAGIVRMSNTNPQLPADKGVSFREFELLAHEAAQMKITGEQVVALKKIFDENDVDKSGSIDQKELAEILLRIFVDQTLTVEEIASLFDEWLDAGMQDFDRDTFVAFVARFAKLHEQDWHLCIAFKELFGENVLDNVNDPIHPGTLERACAPLLNDDCSLEQLKFMTSWYAPDGAADGAAAGTADAPYKAMSTVERQLSLRDILTLLLLTPWTRKPPMPSELLAQDDIRENAESREDCGTLPCEHAVHEAEGHEPQAKRQLTSVCMATPEGAAIIASRSNFTARQSLHLLIEDPSSSNAAKVISLVMGVLICLSVMLLIAEPLLPKFGGYVYVEGIFTIIFTIEYLCRLLAANAFGRRTLEWMLQPMSICDLIAVLPFYVLLAVGHTESAGDSIMVRCIRLVRLSRIGRIGRLHNMCPIVGPIGMVLLIIWFIYLKSHVK